MTKVREVAIKLARPFLGPNNGVTLTYHNQDVLVIHCEYYLKGVLTRACFLASEGLASTMPNGPRAVIERAFELQSQRPFCDWADGKPWPFKMIYRKIECPDDYCTTWVRQEE